jgi:hypothetical protein
VAVESKVSLGLVHSEPAQKNDMARLQRRLSIQLLFLSFFSLD